VGGAVPAGVGRAGENADGPALSGRGRTAAAPFAPVDVTLAVPRIGGAVARDRVVGASRAVAAGSAVPGWAEDPGEPAFGVGALGAAAPGGSVL